MQVLHLFFLFYNCCLCTGELHSLTFLFSMLNASFAFVLECKFCIPFFYASFASICFVVGLSPATPFPHLRSPQQRWVFFVGWGGNVGNSVHGDRLWPLNPNRCSRRGFSVNISAGSREKSRGESRTLLIKGVAGKRRYPFTTSFLNKLLQHIHLIIFACRFV